MVRFYNYENYYHWYIITDTYTSLVRLSRHYFQLVYSDFVISYVRRIYLSGTETKNNLIILLFKYDENTLSHL